MNTVFPKYFVLKTLLYIFGNTANVSKSFILEDSYQLILYKLKIKLNTYQPK